MRGGEEAPTDVLELPWRPCPPMDHWSDRHLLAVELSNLVGPALWVMYANLAIAYNQYVHRERLGWPKLNAKTFGSLIDDIDQRLAGRLAGPSVPWHRIRDDHGFARGRHEAFPPDGRIHDLDNWCNVMWKLEGGKLMKGFGGRELPQAVEAQRIDLARDIRDGRVVFR